MAQDQKSDREKKREEWLKNRKKASAMRRQTAEEGLDAKAMVGVLLDDFSAEYDPMRAGGPSDPWRQGGLGPIPDMPEEGVCPACQGECTDASGEPCPHCEGTGTFHELGDAEDQLNTPGVDPLEELPPTGTGTVEPKAGTGTVLPKYGNRMQWRAQESKARQLFGQ